MKRILSIIAAVLAVSLSAFAQGSVVWTDATSLPVSGKITPDTYEPFSRLPESMMQSARKVVWNLGRNSAGLYVKFTTDAPVVSLRWTSGFGNSLDNMSDINTRGVDLYILHQGKWQFIGNGRPRKKEPPYEASVSCDLLEPGFHEFMLYLSMYDGVGTLEIGVPEGCTLKASELNSPRAEKPVIMYGTSILQGGSSSRPGCAATNVLSRKLDRTVINLGFSGNAKLDLDMAQYMASYPDPGVFVLDNLPNCNAKEIADGQEKFFRVLRDAHPDVPVVFVENPVFPSAHFDRKSKEYLDNQLSALKTVYDKLRKEGEKNIHYVKGDKLLGDGTECTIDGAHFTDIGYQHYVEVLYPVLKKLTR